MKFSYNKLWKLLIDKGWIKSKLRQEAGISSFTIAKLDVTTDVLLKICIALNCRIEAIIVVDTNE